MYRIYRGLGLKVLKRGGRKRAVGTRKIEKFITAAHQCWALDFVHDSFANERKLSLLTVVDVFTRESLKIVVNTSLSAHSVIAALEEIIEDRGNPEKFLSDNGTEFTSNKTIQWQSDRQIAWEHIEPGKPQ